MSTLDENALNFSLKQTIEDYFKKRADRIGNEMLEEYALKIKQLMSECVASTCVEVFRMISMSQLGNTLTIEIINQNQKKAKP